MRFIQGRSNSNCQTIVRAQRIDKKIQQIKAINGLLSNRHTEPIAMEVLTRHSYGCASHVEIPLEKPLVTGPGDFCHPGILDMLNGRHYQNPGREAPTWQQTCYHI